MAKAKVTFIGKRRKPQARIPMSTRRGGAMKDKSKYDRNPKHKKG